jgi:pyrimidine and pyridine-specific 5'-nucleotidase
VRLLGVDNLFEGLTYCDYSQVPFVCKPQKGMFLKAMKEAGISDVSKCFFVGKIDTLVKQLWVSLMFA